MLSDLETEEFGELYDANQLKDSDLNSKKVASFQNITSTMTNRSDVTAETSPLSSSAKNFDVCTNVKSYVTSKLRMQPESSSINAISKKGNSDHGKQDIPQCEKEKSDGDKSNEKHTYLDQVEIICGR